MFLAVKSTKFLFIMRVGNDLNELTEHEESGVTNCKVYALLSNV